MSALLMTLPHPIKLASPWIAAEPLLPKVVAPPTGPTLLGRHDLRSGHPEPPQPLAILSGLRS